MKSKKPTVQEWNLTFLKEHLKRISSQNQYNEIDWMNLVDKEAIALLYKNLEEEDNPERIIKGEYPIITTCRKENRNQYTRFILFDCKSQETEDKYIVEINHQKTKKLKSACNDPYTYLTNKFKHIIIFDKKEYHITLETQVKLAGAEDLQPATFSTFSLVNNEAYKTEWERLSIEDDYYTEESKRFIRDALPETKILANALTFNYGYDHWYHSSNGTMRIINNKDLYYGYNHYKENDTKKEEPEYYLRVEANPQTIKIEKSYPNDDNIKYYTSYEEFLEELEELAKDDELLLVLENAVKKLQQLNACSNFYSPEKKPQKLLK